MNLATKPRVFIVTNAMTPLNKSSEVTTSKFIRVLQSCYRHITLLGGNITLEPDLADVQIQSYPYQKGKANWRKLVSMLRLQIQLSIYLLRHVKKEDPVIFWLGDKMLFPFLTARLMSQHVGYFVYGNLATEGNSSLFMRISASVVLFMANHAHRVFVESPSVEKGWKGLLKKEVFPLHLYTEDSSFNPLENRRNKIGLLCRLAEVKHVRQAIEAFVQIHTLYPDWTLEMIGTGNQEILCRQHIQELHAQSYITLFGWCSKQKIASITKEWKFNMLCSDHEGLPNSMIEMMGRGIPLIANPVGGIPDILKDGVNGFCLRGVTVKDIQEGITKAIQAKTQYPQLAQAAFESISQAFSLSGARQLAQQQLLNW